jgi:hypothetical protein
MGKVLDFADRLRTLFQVLQYNKTRSNHKGFTLDKRESETKIGQLLRKYTDVASL